MRIPFAAALAAILAACTYVAPDTLVELSAISPLEADPADIAVSVVVPDGIAIPAGRSQLAIRAERSDTGEVLSEEAALLRSSQNGRDVFEIAPEDRARLRTAQALARAWEAEAPRATSGSISVTSGFCRVGAGPATDARVSIDIRTSPEGAFIPLVRNAPLRQVMKRGGLTTIGPC
ncbi:MAG: hypothetical protein AAGP08_06735 [Pseudomonadota bacterium]